MARKDISTLRDDAMVAVGKGKLGKAAELYEELEVLEPQSAAWPKRLGETHRRAGDNAAAVVAFERAAEKFVQSGFLVQAIAVCRMILQIDPAHVATVERLAALAPAPQVTVERVRQRASVDIPPGSSLDSIELAAVVAGSHSPPNLDGSSSGITILPLGQPSSLELSLAEIELVPETPAISATARLALIRTPLFAELHPRVLEQLLPRIELVELAAGDTLFHEGDAGGSLYVISEGEVTVETSGNELARLGPGAFFGEIALVTDLPRSATVRALTSVQLLGLDRELVRDAAAEQAAVINVLLRFVRERLIGRMLRTSELFRPFADHDRAELASRFELVEAVPGARLVIEGQRADGLYVMVSGRVDVTRDGNPAPVTQLASGDVFGEMSLLSGGGSTASVTTASRVLALRMPARTFTEVIMTHPQVLAYLGELADRRAPRVETGEFLDLHIDLL